MTPARRLFDRLSRSYAERDFAAAAACHDLPGALYLEDDVIVWSSPERLARFLAEHCGSNRSIGVCRAEPVVMAELHHSERQFSAWVEWRHFDAKGAEVYSLRVRYFCRSIGDGEAQIQLVEVPKRPAVYRKGAVAGAMRQETCFETRSLATLH